MGSLTAFVIYAFALYLGYTSVGIIPIAIGDGIPNIDVKRTTKTPAIAAIRIWLPTNKPIRSITALVSFPTLSRRDAGTRESPSDTAWGSDVMKYSVSTKIVSAVKNPERML